LSTFFGLLCLLAYVRFVRVAPEPNNPTAAAPISHLPSPIFYALSLVCFALSLMSKSMLVTLPCVLLLLDFWPLRRCPISNLNPHSAPLKRVLLEKVPFLLLSLGSSLLTFMVQREAGATSSLDALPL